MLIKCNLKCSHYIKSKYNQQIEKTITEFRSFYNKNSSFQYSNTKHGVRSLNSIYKKIIRSVRQLPDCKDECTFIFANDNLKSINIKFKSMLLDFLNYHCRY